MVDLGQTGGRDSACLFFITISNKKNRLLSQSLSYGKK
jgi:hypothetical protein